MFMKSSPPVERAEQNLQRNTRPALGSVTPTPTTNGVHSAPAVVPPESGNKESSSNSAPIDKSTNDKSTEKDAGARLIVGPDVKLKGAEILDCDMLVVEGRVEATMDSRVIRIADKGSFSGKVSIDVAEIHGRFDGELTARSQLIIHATGRVSGKIRYGKLVIAEGGELCGDINALAAEKNHPPILSALTA
jgi:cytoskeletal protein CcmA (bactofilin family)